MGAAVIAVVFVAGLLGVPSLFGHGAKPPGPQQQSQQVASVQTPVHGVDAAAPANGPNNPTSP